MNSTAQRLVLLVFILYFGLTGLMFMSDIKNNQIELQKDIVENSCEVIIDESD